MDLIKIIEKCAIETVKIYVQLSNNLPENLTLEPMRGGNYCFRISGFNKTNNDFDMVSVSYPPDAMGNRGAPYDGPNPETIETALFKDGKLVYISSLGYEDIKRFRTFEELLEEIESLK
jgi:hypothetical protein